MSDHDESPAQVPVTWREYIIRLPKQLADTLDKALGMQKQMEDREIENSEYWAWLLMLGLMEVQRQNAVAKAADRQVVAASEVSQPRPPMPTVKRGVGGSWDVTL